MEQTKTFAQMLLAAKAAGHSQNTLEAMGRAYHQTVTAHNHCSARQWRRANTAAQAAYNEVRHIGLPTGLYTQYQRATDVRIKTRLLFQMIKFNLERTPQWKGNTRDKS